MCHVIWCVNRRDGRSEGRPKRRDEKSEEKRGEDKIKDGHVTKWHGRADQLTRRR